MVTLIESYGQTVTYIAYDKNFLPQHVIEIAATLDIWAIEHATLFFTITPKLLGGFFTLYVPIETEKNNLQNRYKIYKFTLTVFFSIAAVVSAVRYDRGRQLPAVSSIKLVVGILRRKSTNVLFYSFVRYSLMSLCA